jgi:hypothetical protein
MLDFRCHLEFYPETFSDVGQYPFNIGGAICVWVAKAMFIGLDFECIFFKKFDGFIRPEVVQRKSEEFGGIAVHFYEFVYRQAVGDIASAAASAKKF